MVLVCTHCDVCEANQVSPGKLDFPFGALSLINNGNNRNGKYFEDNLLKFEKHGAR